MKNETIYFILKIKLSYFFSLKRYIPRFYKITRTFVCKIRLVDNERNSAKFGRIKLTQRSLLTAMTYGKFQQIFLASSLNSSSPWCRDAFILME